MHTGRSTVYSESPELFEFNEHDTLAWSMEGELRHGQKSGSGNYVVTFDNENLLIAHRFVRLNRESIHGILASINEDEWERIAFVRNIPRRAHTTL